MSSRVLVPAYRLGFAALSLVAMGVQLARSVALGFDPVHFFSYFTNLSNILAAIVLICAAVRPPSRAIDFWRGAATVYMSITGIVYVTLLSGLPLGGLLPWVNVVHHMIMPVVLVLDWLVNPPALRLRFRDSLWWLAFPLVWVVYTTIRGPLVGWYPYPFLDPAQPGGYGAVAIYAVVILAAFVAVVALVTWVGNALGAASRRH